MVTWWSLLLIWYQESAIIGVLECFTLTTRQGGGMTASVHRFSYRHLVNRIGVQTYHISIFFQIQEPYENEIQIIKIGKNLPGKVCTFQRDKGRDKDVRIQETPFHKFVSTVEVYFQPKAEKSSRRPCCVFGRTIGS